MSILKFKYMRKSKILIAGLCLMSFTVRQKAHSSFESNMGVYLSPDDFLHDKLSYAADSHSGDLKIKLHEEFGSSELEVIYKGKKQVLSKDRVYGYRDAKEQNFRFVGHAVYHILDTAGFYLYSYNKLVQGEKIARPQTVYYFSIKAGDPVLELTLDNLEKSFADNAPFRYRLEAQFRSDKELTAYDGIGKTYKIKYVFSQSSK
jgi:hypothetical protein